MESSNGGPLPRVLVVDDQPATLLAIEAELELLGAEVTRAESGEAALLVLQTAEFALILLDVNLPGISGLDVALRLRAAPQTRETPIIFITAYDQDDRDVLAAYAFGAVDFLFKPLRLEALRAKARVFINLSRQAELLVDGDHVRLVQVATNLLNNAARYTPAGGALRVACWRVDEHVDLHVQDNGIGIATEDLSELFEPFTQEGRHDSSGLGLGLAIVRRLVLLHGGSVEARSAGPGRGSEFVVRLPLSSVNDEAVDVECGACPPEVRILGCLIGGAFRSHSST